MSYIGCISFVFCVLDFLIGSEQLVWIFLVLDWFGKYIFPSICEINQNIFASYIVLSKNSKITILEMAL